MNPILEHILGQNTAYQELPKAIQVSYSEKQWLWLSDREKAKLVQTETEPEPTLD